MPASACDAVGYVTWRDGVQQGYVTGLESSEHSLLSGHATGKSRSN